MGKGLGLGLPGAYGAAGGVEALDKFLLQIVKEQELERIRKEKEEEKAYNRKWDEETRRREDAKTAKEETRYAAEQEIAAAGRRAEQGRLHVAEMRTAADDVRKQQEDQALQGVLATMTPAQQKAHVLKIAKDFHRDVETPEEHEAHVQKTRKEELTDFEEKERIRAKYAYHAPVAGAGGKSPGDISAMAKAVIEGTVKLDDLAPTARGAIAAELNAAGFKRSSPISAQQREKIADFETLLSEAAGAAAILTGMPADPAKGEAGKAGLKTGPIDTTLHRLNQLRGQALDYTDYDSMISNLNSVLLKARSGAAVTQQEYDRIKPFIPLKTDDEKIAARKLVRFHEELTRIRNNYIQRASQLPEALRDSMAAPASREDAADEPPRFEIIRPPRKQ